MAKFGWWSRTENPQGLIFPDFFHEFPLLPLSGGSYLRGRWVAYFSLYPSCAFASGLLVSGPLQVLGSAPGVVPAHLAGRPKLVVLDSFYRTDLFGQTGASQLKHSLLHSGGTQSRAPHAEVHVPKQSHLQCHCSWLFTVFSDDFSQPPSKHLPEYKFIFHFQWVANVETNNSKFLWHTDLKMLRFHCLPGNYLGCFLVIHGFIIFVYCIT